MNECTEHVKINGANVGWSTRPTMSTMCLSNQMRLQFKRGRWGCRTTGEAERERGITMRWKEEKRSFSLTMNQVICFGTTSHANTQGAVVITEGYKENASMLG